MHETDLKIVLVSIDSVSARMHDIHIHQLETSDRTHLMHKVGNEIGSLQRQKIPIFWLKNTVSDRVILGRALRVLPAFIACEVDVPASLHFFETIKQIDRRLLVHHTNRILFAVAQLGEGVLDSR